VSDSLVLGDVELLGGGVVNENPACAGAVFSLLPGYDIGAPQPTADFVADLLLDGERPFGRRASNRTIALPVYIYAPDRDTLAAAREHIESIVDQDSWPLIWTRDSPNGPLPLVIDCFRGEPTVVAYDVLREKQLMMQMALTIPAFPYGRSDAQERLQFASPVPSGPPPPPSQVVIDTFATISSPQAYQTERCIIGPNSLAWDPDAFGDPGGQNSLFTYSVVLANSLDLTSMTSIGMWLGFGSRYYWLLDLHGLTSGVQVEITLTDTVGNDLSFSRSHMRLPVTPNPQAPYFSHVTMRLPQNDPTFQYSSVAGYTIKVANHYRLNTRRLRNVVLYLDALTAFPDSQTVTPVTRGAVYTLFGIKGSARAAMSMALAQPPTAGTPTTVTAAGLGSYTAPLGTAWLKVETVAPGGAGAQRTTAGMGGGGGAGEYSREDVFPAAPGDVIPYVNGVGGTTGATPVDGATTQFGPGPAGPLVVISNGGKSALQNSIVGGLGGTGSPNSVHFDGGAGRTATGSFGGGGGSSGGSASPGSTPMGTTALSFTSAGTTSWTATFTGLVFAETWGSGAGGATGYSGGNGQAGSGGEYAGQFVPVTQGVSYPVVVAAAGAGASGGNQLPGSNGNSSSFTGDGGAQVLSHGGVRGLATNSSGLGPAGGTGSTNTVHHDGGRGGGAEPYGGGGGSSGSPSGNGNNGDSYGHAGSAPTDGGAGGNGSGASTSTPGSNGVAPGGGGGGTYFSTTAGNGAVGKVRLTFAGGVPDQHGAPAVTGGGAGADGGATTNSVGSAGSQPGGGGGGANSGGTSENGGGGGTGRIIVTPFASAAWKSLIVHRPPRGSSKLFQPLVSVGGGSDTPNGATFYTLPQPVSGVNALFQGTYTIYAIASSFNGSGSRTLTITVRQTESTGGTTYSQSTIPVSFTPSMITNGIVCAGVITLPVKQLPKDNTQASFAVSVTDSNTADRYLDCIFFDTMGQTQVINRSSAGYINYYLDAPDANTALGLTLGSQTDRSAAVSVLGDINTVLSGGVLTVDPADGDNMLFAYSPDAQAPAIGVTYFPTWFFDRTSLGGDRHAMDVRTSYGGGCGDRSESAFS
jgi:hypothetical protein